MLYAFCGDDLTYREYTSLMLNFTVKKLSRLEAACNSIYRNTGHETNVIPANVHNISLLITDSLIMSLLFTFSTPILLFSIQTTYKMILIIKNIVLKWLTD